MRRGRWKRKNVRRDFGRGGPKIAYHTGAGRESVPSNLRCPPHGRGGVPQRFGSRFPRRGCGGQRVAKPHLILFYLRAFRSARRCRVLCGGTGGCGHPPLRGSIGHASVGTDTHISPLQRPHRPPVQRQRLHSRSRFRRAADAASSLRGDAACPLRVKEKQRQCVDHPDGRRTRHAAQG